MKKEGLRQNDKKWHDDNFIAHKLEEAFGYSEEQLAEELDRAAALAAQQPDPRLEPPEGEFQKIMERVEKEKKAERKVVRLKRILKPMLVAALLGGVILGSGIGVNGLEGVEYTVRRQGEENIIFNNTETSKMEDSIEAAYEHIGDTLGIPAVECFYMPNGMKFEKATLSKNRAKLEFMYEENHIHFYQVLWNLSNSANYISDRKPYKEIYNRYLDCDISIYKNELEGEEPEFGAQFFSDKAYYYYYGIMKEEEFIKIVKYMKFYEK